MKARVAGSMRKPKAAEFLCACGHPLASHDQVAGVVYGCKEIALADFVGHDVPCPCIAYRPAEAAPKANKYGARRTSCGVHDHDSAKEAKRCGELRLMERSGAINQLTRQVPYPFIINGVKIATYISDFNYCDPSVEGDARAQRVVEDCKGFRTREYQIKKKLMKALYGVEIRET